MVNAVAVAAAAAILTDEIDILPRVGIPVIRVPGLRQHVGEIAARFHGYPSRQMRVIAVTGTNGKTTVAHLCADALRTPAMVIRLTVESVYLHCAKAFMRSGLWDATRHTDRAQLPSMAEMMRDQIRAFKGEEIEAEAQDQMLARYRQSL
jgi:hypothetical protein